jgi:hypothetical protein
MGISAVFPKDLLGGKSLFWSLSVLQSGHNPWLTCKTSPEGLEHAQ